LNHIIERETNQLNSNTISAYQPLKHTHNCQNELCQWVPERPQVELIDKPARQQAKKEYKRPEGAGRAHSGAIMAPGNRQPKRAARLCRLSTPDRR